MARAPKLVAKLHHAALRSADRAFALAAAFAVAFCAVAASWITICKGLNADGAAWVQAAGSIAAIAGAVWVSTAEGRRQRRARRHEREEVAWGVRFAIVQAQYEVRTIAGELVGARVLDDPKQGRHWKLRIENSKNVLQNYMTRNDHVHPALVQISSNALLLLTQMEEDVDLAIEAMAKGSRPPPDVATEIAAYESYFGELLEQLDQRMRGIREALDDSEDILPVKDWEAWRRDN